MLSMGELLSILYDILKFVHENLPIKEMCFVAMVVLVMAALVFFLVVE